MLEKPFNISALRAAVGDCCGGPQLWIHLAFAQLLIRPYNVLHRQSAMGSAMGPDMRWALLLPVPRMVGNVSRGTERSDRLGASRMKSVKAHHVEPTTDGENDSWSGT